MSAWIVYSKDGAEKCRVSSLEYNGEYLGACSVNLNIQSPTPIEFEIGDWIEYRGERFELNYDPSVIKESSANTYGEGFVYDNIVLNSLSDELTRCDFLDYVREDNGMHYSSLPTFSFYAETIEALAERIEVNLDRIYTGEKKWTVVVHSEHINTKNVNISISNQTCWDALGLVKTMFDTNFIIRGRKIIIGTSGIAVGNLFSYGKGNGLYKIERNAESGQKIITRLRAYGSTRNLPASYYRNLEGGNVPNNMAVRNLMLPSFPSTLDPYIDSKNIDKLGIREGTIFFDGSGDLEEIFPTLEGMTAESLKDAGITVNATGELDVIVSAEQIEDDGVIPEEGQGKLKGSFTVELKDIGFDINDYLSTEAATLSMKDGMCGGRDFEITKCEKTSTGYRLTCNRHEDTGLGLAFPYNGYQIKAGDKFVLLNIEMPDVYVKAASQRLLAAANDYLSKNDYVRYSYTPTIDNIWVARQHEEAIANNLVSIHDTIKEGDFILFEDKDLGIQGSITIDSLTIKENADNNIIPEYELTLKNEKTVGTIEKIQNQVLSIINGGGGSSMNTDQVSSIVKAVGSTIFLSKKKDDRTPYNLGVGKNLTVGGDVVSEHFANETIKGGYAIRKNEDGEYDMESDNIIARILAKTYDLFVQNHATFVGNLSSEEFISGFLGGKGWSIRMKEWLNAAGVMEKKSVAEFDDLIVRGSIRVFEFIVSQLLGENDNRVFTGMMEVDHYDAADGKIYLKTDGGKLYNPFRVDDVIIVQQYGQPTEDNGYYVTKQYEFVVTEAKVGNLSDGEDRLDWITFSNFTTTIEGGSESLIAERDTLVRIDNLTNNDRKGIIQMMAAGKDTPYMDFIYGKKTDPENSLKGRLGNLGGVWNELFGKGGWLRGFGAYLTNLYAVGEFVIAHTGENVSDTIEIAKGQFRTNFRQTTYDLSEEDNFFTNAALTNNCEHWILGSEDGTEYFMVDGLPQFFNFDVYATEDSYAGLVEWKGRDMLRLNKSAVRQLNPLIRKAGTHKVYEDSVMNEDGTFTDSYDEVPDTLYLSVRLYVAGTGNVEIGFIGEDGAFIDNDFHVAREMVADEDAYNIKLAGTWDGIGDFCITSTGDVYVDMLSLTDKPLENFKTETWSAIEQNAEKIRLTAGRIQASGGSLADLTVKYNEISGQVSSLQDEFGVTQKELEDFQIEAKSEFEFLSKDVLDLGEWKTGLENAGLTSTMIQQTEDTIKIVAGSFEKDKDGKYVLTSAAGSLVYAEAEKAINEQFATLDGKYAKVETSVQYDPETHEITSDVRISADNIKLEADKVIEIINKEGTISVEAARLDLNGAITANGTFKIDTDGTMTCSGGTIGGFHISGNNLTNEGRNNDASVIFVNTETDCIAAMGGNIIPFETGATGVALFQNHKKDEFGLIANYAAIFSSKGTHDNVAIDIEGGAVQGFAMRNTIVDSTFKVLFRNDYNVVCINSSDCEITLPAMKLAEDGHVVRIKRLGAGGVKIKMQHCETFENESSRPVMFYDSNDVKVGDETIALPNKGDACEFVWVRDLKNTVNGTTYYGAWVQYKFPRSW